MYVIILCANYQEGLAYAQSQKFGRGKYRIATRAGNIKGLKVAELHELPSFGKRRDKAKIMSMLRYAKVPAHFLIDDGWEWPRRSRTLEQIIEHVERGGPDDPTPTVATLGANGAPVGEAVAEDVEPLAQGSEVLDAGIRTEHRKRRRRTKAQIAAEAQAAQDPEAEVLVVDSETGDHVEAPAEVVPELLELARQNTVPEGFDD